jgi:protein-S-isoprenylcysteine O-methyltransferase Ste14
MPLREELEATGNWLFRHRSYLPLLLLVVVVAALRDFRYPRGSHALDEWWEVVCVAVALAGVAIRAATIGYTPHGTSGRNTHGQVAESLNTTGAYSLVRHPLYVGNYLMWLGPALFPRSWATAVIVTLVFWLYYERIMLAEEEFLRRKFGAAYEQWAAATPAFIPRLRGWRAPPLPFSVRNVLRREYSGVFGVVATFALLEAVGDFFATGRVGVDPLWAGLFGATLVLYLVLRFLKRSTSVLRVDGR